MGVVIRMNMAAGLGRAELSPGCSEKQMSVDPHLPSMLGRRSVRSQLWSPQGHSTSGARKIIGFFFSSWFTVSPLKAVSDCLSHCRSSLSLPVCLSVAPTCAQHTKARTHFVQIQIFLAWRASFRLWSRDQRFWPCCPVGLWPRLVKSRDAWI